MHVQWTAKPTVLQNGAPGCYSTDKNDCWKPLSSNGIEILVQYVQMRFESTAVSKSAKYVKLR